MSFTLSPEVRANVKRESQMQGVSVSDFIEQALISSHSEQMKSKQIQLAPKPIWVLTEFVRIQSKIASIAEEFKIAKLSLFGSLVDQTATSASDIDLLVSFHPAHTAGMFKLAALQIKLSEIFEGSTVDLKTSGEISKYFRDNITQKAVVLFQSRSRLQCVKSL